MHSQGFSDDRTVVPAYLLGRLPGVMVAASVGLFCGVSAQAQVDSAEAAASPSPEAAQTAAPSESLPEAAAPATEAKAAADGASSQDPKAPKSTLSFEMRTDLQHDAYKNLPETNEGDDKALLFRFQRARLGLKGEIVDRLKYRVRLRFDKGLNPKTSKFSLKKADLDGGGAADDEYVAGVKENTHIENVGDALDLAFVDFGFSDSAGLQIGRFNTNICGADVSNSIDAYGELAAALKKCSATYTRTGAGLYFSPLNDHRFDLVAANQTDTVDKNQDQPMLGLMYTGKIADGAFEPRATFHLIPKREIKAKGATSATKKAAQDLFWNLGGDLKFGKVTAKLDYASYASGDQTASGPKPGDSSTTSYVARVSYRFAQWEPLVMGSLSTDEAKSADKGKKVTVKTEDLGVTAAVHYYPTSWKKFRLHGAYSRYASKADTDGAKEKTTDTFLVGAAFVGDVPL